MDLLKIQFKKGKDERQHSLRLERPDGSSEWGYIKSIVHHDLAHFVVESHFKIARGFYGEILRGVTMETLTSAGVTKAYDWSTDIFLAETLVNAFQQIILMGEGFDAFADHLALIADKKTVGPHITSGDFDEVKSKLIQIWQEWDKLHAGQSLNLEFFQCATA
jgi:hypothetical protein